LTLGIVPPNSKDRSTLLYYTERCYKLRVGVGGKGGGRDKLTADRALSDDI
jgi:hypothetical protein